MKNKGKLELCLNCYSDKSQKREIVLHVTERTAFHSATRIELIFFLEIVEKD